MIPNDLQEIRTALDHQHTPSVLSVQKVLDLCDEIEQLRARVASQERVVAAARYATTEGRNWDGVYVLAKALEAYDAAGAMQLSTQSETCSGVKSSEEVPS